MFSAFGTALSALSANATAIDVVGNNLANLNTTGFKASQVTFSDLMSQSLGGSINPGQVGLGVGPIRTTTNYTQGTITTTNVPTNAAIQGNGFFIVKDQNNQTLYTRDGSFQVDPSGNLITSSGQMVQGWSAVNGVVSPTGSVGTLSVPLGAVVPASATKTMALNVNLNASTGTTGTGASYTAPIQIYDSLGASHTVNITFTKTATNAWDYSVALPDADFSAAGPPPLATGSLTFNPDGSIATPDPTGGPIPLDIAGLADGASDFTVQWSLFDENGGSLVTQFAQPSSVGNTFQDGMATGQISSVSIQNGGLIIASYSNGSKVTVGQLAVASISNPQTLTSVGDNNLQASATTASPAIGPADTAGRGKIIGGALEASTADMATEFSNLLSYERSYQAASRVITAADQLMQETVNLIHG